MGNRWCPFTPPLNGGCFDHGEKKKQASQIPSALFQIAATFCLSKRLQWGAGREVAGHLQEVRGGLPPAALLHADPARILHLGGPGAQVRRELRYCEGRVFVCLFVCLLVLFVC